MKTQKPQPKEAKPPKKFKKTLWQERREWVANMTETYYQPPKP